MTMPMDRTSLTSVSSRGVMARGASHMLLGVGLFGASVAGGAVAVAGLGEHPAWGLGVVAATLALYEARHVFNQGCKEIKDHGTRCEGL